MRWIGHTEFGPNYIPIHHKDLIHENSLDLNHWLEQWHLTYSFCYRNFLDSKNISFICYEQLCSSNSYWEEILEILNINKKYDFEFVESQKQIHQDIDDELHLKTFSLYSKLKRLV